MVSKYTVGEGYGSKADRDMEVAWIISVRERTKFRFSFTMDLKMHQIAFPGVEMERGRQPDRLRGGGGRSFVRQGQARRNVMHKALCLFMRTLGYNG